MLSGSVTGLLDVMGAPGGYAKEGRDVAVVVEQRVKFDAALGASELRPREDAEAQGHEARVEGVEFVAEAELMVGGLNDALLVERHEQGLEDLIRSAFIRIGHGAAPDAVGPAEVVEKSLLGLQGEHEVTEACLA